MAVSKRFVPQTKIVRRTMAALVFVLGCAWATVGTNALTVSPATADGPTPCSAGPPPAAFHGFCATYAGRNTWYGSYGSGFPSNLGWGFCGENAGEGGGYPVPGYDYTPSGAPADASTGELNALGFALSEFQAQGWWNGDPAQFTADQAAAAGKLFYDQIVWGQALGTLDPGVTAAFDGLTTYYQEAQGITGTPGLLMALAGGGAAFASSATVNIVIGLPGTARGLADQALLLSITNGTFNASNGPTTIGVTTDASGGVSIPIFATGPVTVTVDTATNVGTPGIGYYRPTNPPPGGAQYLASVVTPTGLSASLNLSATSPPSLPGTISVQKGVNDGAYYGPGGAVFQILFNGNVVDTLTTDISGDSAASAPLSPGGYVVHELTAPFGYARQVDQQITVVSGENTVAAFTAQHEDLAIPAHLTLSKVDGRSNAPLAGAVIDLKYDATNNGVYNDDLGTCTTGAAGQCNVASGLLPGDYEATEVSPPPGYDLNAADDVQLITLAPGQSGALTFVDYKAEVRIIKTGDDAAYDPITGAIFTVTGPIPATTSVGTLTVASSGLSNVLALPASGTYLFTETSPPSGYTAVAPFMKAVTDSSQVLSIDVHDLVTPATLSITKLDAQTKAPLAGAVLDVAYAPQPGGPYSDDLGRCTTTLMGLCEVNGDDGLALYPGNYQVTEVSPPPGYVLPTQPTQQITLSPGESGSVTFNDQPLLPVTFHKSATGNVNPIEMTLAGATFVVNAGSVAGPTVATCTTDASGACTTQATLTGAATYCWIETTAPAGLATSPGGCFIATDGQSATPIAVSDAGEFVAITVKKVDAADPQSDLPGAVFDLFRKDNGSGPQAPVPPAGAATETGQTWVARATTGANGVATFPLQYPGYAYCAVEVIAPANYQLSTDTPCTSVLLGTVTTPVPVTVLTVGDTESRIDLAAHKFNAQDPNTAIPGAVYDLYVEGAGPPSGVPDQEPPGAAKVAGDTWYARGTTDNQGNLLFSVPAGYAWCLKETTAVVNYQLDVGLRCSAVLDSDTPKTSDTIALPENVADVVISANKFNSLQPGTRIPGARYELLVEGAPPLETPPNSDESSVTTPPGDMYWSDGTTDSQGILSWSVPGGYRWCLHELSAPSGYQVDTGYHCTAVVSSDSADTTGSVALPELPTASSAPVSVLAFTGGPSSWIFRIGLFLMVAGGCLLIDSKRRQRRSRHLVPIDHEDHEA
jgi:Prealbumin-like fold domain